MSVAASLDPDVDAARRIAFAIRKAENRLGLTGPHLSVDDLMQAILAGAASRPGVVEPTVYGMVYLLAQGGRQ